MELTISFFFQVDAAHSETVTQAFREVAAPTRQEPGCVLLEITRDETDSGRFHVYSRWKNDAAFETHVNLKHTRDFFEKVRSLIRESTAPSRLRALG